MSSQLFEALDDEGGGQGGVRTLAEYWGVPSAADAIETMAADPASQAGKVVKAKAKRKVVFYSLSPTLFCGSHPACHCHSAADLPSLNDPGRLTNEPSIS
jgi:hypothetical protein